MTAFGFTFLSIAWLVYNFYESNRDTPPDWLKIILVIISYVGIVLLFASAWLLMWRYLP